MIIQTSKKQFYDNLGRAFHSIKFIMHIAHASSPVFVCAYLYLLLLASDTLIVVAYHYA
jgi:hypothetical protein